MSGSSAHAPRVQDRPLVEAPFSQRRRLRSVRGVFRSAEALRYMDHYERSFVVTPATEWSPVLPSPIFHLKPETCSQGDPNHDRRNLNHSLSPAS